jgi:superfamily II DNA or RNA helicase
MKLRDYQLKAIDDIRTAFRSGSQRVCLCLPTGAGKTAIATAIMHSIYRNGKRVWFCVPRLELINQTRKSLTSFGVPHGIINASKKDYRQLVCIVSRDTLIRHLDHYPPPDIIFFDEAHIALDQQRKIAFAFPKTRIIGMTATPERKDGIPLKITELGDKQGVTVGLYETLIQSESIPHLQAQGVLAGLDYYGMRLEGVDVLPIYGGLEAGQELDKLIVYGDIVEQYKTLGSGRQAIGFAPTIAIAQKCVNILNASGFNFELIHGDMHIKKRQKLIAALNNKEINGLVNAALLTYGFDSPIVSYAFSVRYIKSRPLWMQMVGRILRGHPHKETALFVDHTGTIYNFMSDGRGGTYGDNGYNNIFEDTAIVWHFAGSNNILKCMFDTEKICSRLKKHIAPHCIFNLEHSCVNLKNYLKYKDEHFINTERRCLDFSAQGGCPELLTLIGRVKHKKKCMEIEQIKKELVNLSTKKEVFNYMFNVSKLWDTLDNEEKLKHIEHAFVFAKKYNYNPLWIYHQFIPDHKSLDLFLLKTIQRLTGKSDLWLKHHSQRLKET